MTQKETPLPQRPANHRTRVAIERREKTRARLLKGALVVFSRHGADAKIIDQVIKESGVARGTFYNYFRTNEELFMEVAREVSNEIIGIVDPMVNRQRDPAARIACGVSTVARLAKAYPVFAQFVARGGPAALSAGNLATEVVPRDIRDGIASGRFSVVDEQLAFSLILGPVIMAFHVIVSSRVSDSFPQDLAQAVLQSLGVSKAIAYKFSRLDFGDFKVADNSLFSLSQSIHVRH